VLIICKLTAKQQKFRIVCDGKLVLQWLCWTHITDPAESHANLLSVARYLMQNSRVMVDLHYIKGHQDSKCIGPFTRDVTLNIEADQLTQEKLATYRPGPTMFHIP